MRTITLMLLGLIVASMNAAAADRHFIVWVADPLTKIFQYTPPPAYPPDHIYIRAARNEYESGQIVVTATSTVTSLTVGVSPIAGPGSVKPQVSWNFVGFVPVEHGTPYTPSDHLIAIAPDNFPDPLLEFSSVSVQAGRNQPIWITVRVPANTRPGTYTGTITLTGDGAQATVPLIIEVSPAMLPNYRTLNFSNWFNIETIADYHGLTQWSERYWNMLATYAQFMANYRMNTIRSQINRLIICHDDGTGHYTFDFSRFDRWVELFQSVGAIGTIEGGHLCGRLSWEGSNYYVWYPPVYNPDGTRKTMPTTVATSAQARSFYSQLLPALRDHLRQKGWLDRYIQHVGDEPISQSAASYRGVAAIVREYAPEFKIIDAVQTTNLIGAIDILVPQSHEYNDNALFYESRKSAGEQVWFYTCLTPKGQYMNRFLDYPLLDVRLLHWMNFKYGLPGYLHWGFNFWHGDPFTNIEDNWGSTTTAFSPPGDSHIVYKGINGPLSSIRLEALRDGIEDYELLTLLAKQDPVFARQICDAVVRTMTDYVRDPATFRAIRAQILNALAKNPMSVSQVKSMPVGSRVYLSGAVVTADTRYLSGNMNLYYVEASDRSAGIGIISTGAAACVSGQCIDLYGTTKLLDGAELVIEPDVMSVYPGSMIKPLGMANKATGGGASGGQPAIIDDVFTQPAPKVSSGLNRIGSLVKVWGTVTGSAQTSLGTVFWIDDGAGLHDGFTTSKGLPATGIGVLLPPGVWNIPVGNVIVTGIMRAIPNPSGLPVRLLVPRNGGDIIAITE